MTLIFWQMLSYWCLLIFSYLFVSMFLTATVASSRWLPFIAFAGFLVWFVKHIAEVVWHHQELRVFDLQVTGWPALGVRNAGVHGYNVNVLSPWRQNIALSQGRQLQNTTVTSKKKKKRGEFFCLKILLGKAVLFNARLNWAFLT